MTSDDEVGIEIHETLIFATDIIFNLDRFKIELLSTIILSHTHTHTPHLLIKHG